MCPVHHRINQVSDCKAVREDASFLCFHSFDCTIKRKRISSCSSVCVLSCVDLLHMLPPSAPRSSRVLADPASMAPGSEEAGTQQMKLDHQSSNLCSASSDFLHVSVEDSTTGGEFGSLAMEGSSSTGSTQWSSSRSVVFSFPCYCWDWVQGNPSTYLLPLPLGDELTSPSLFATFSLSLLISVSLSHTQV